MPAKRDEAGEIRPGQGTTAVYLSALVCPGAGQIVQRRWVAAALVGVSFVAGFVVFSVSVVKSLTAYYDLAFHFDQPPPQSVSLWSIVIPFGICMVIYLLGLIDTVLANRRREGAVPRMPKT
jgi:hypothetical protein